MAGLIRYRSGISARTGATLSGADHLAQSLSKIWLTRLEQMPMLLDFGSNLRGYLSEDLTPETALLIYNEMVASAARYEPEYAITQMQLVRLTQSGTLGLRHAGIYYPEGRYGDYTIAQPLTLAPVSIGAAA